MSALEHVVENKRLFPVGVEIVIDGFGPSHEVPLPIDLLALKVDFDIGVGLGKEIEISEPPAVQEDLKARA